MYLYKAWSYKDLQSICHARVKSVFSLKKTKTKNKTKTKQNNKKGSFTLHPALTLLFQEKAESVHVCIFKLHIASCCYIYSCLMTPTEICLQKKTHTHTIFFFFNFQLQWRELTSGKKLGDNVATYLSSLIIWWLLSTVLVNAQYCDRWRKCWLKALSSC